MTNTDHNLPGGHPVDRRRFLGYAAGAGLAAAGFTPGAQAQQSRAGVDLATWTPEAIQAMAGTAEYDTAAECAKVVPLHTAGRVSIWYYGPNSASPQIEHRVYAEFWKAFAETYPNIRVEQQNLDYNESGKFIPAESLAHRQEALRDHIICPNLS
jgi:multiple sugar transport system substrate-binding protein